VRWPASLHAVADRATNGRSRPPSQPSRRHLAVPLRRDRRINRRAWRREGRHHTVARVLKQPAAVRLNPPPHTSSWAASAARIPWASASHRRVEPSTSVNRNVTTPEGAAARAADTPAESHNRQAPTSHIGGSGPVNSSLVSARRRAIITAATAPAASRAPMKEGVTWRRTGPSATPVSITHAYPRALTSSTTRHTTCLPGRGGVILLQHIESSRRSSRTLSNPVSPHHRRGKPCLSWSTRARCVSDQQVRACRATATSP
jgi:hypothetical protein